jgi:TetR/AcrR family transcriptional regulator
VTAVKKDTPTKLLEAATILFARKGFAAVSIRELADASGTNSALISYHFSGKEGLYRAVLDNLFTQVSQALSGIIALQLPPLERIRKLAGLIINTHHQNPYLLRLVNSELTNPTSCLELVVKKYLERNYQFLFTAITEGIAAGEIRPDINPAYAAVSLAGIINFYFLAKPLANHWLPHGTDHDYAYGNQAIDIYLHGIKRV